MARNRKTSVNLDVGDTRVRLTLQIYDQRKQIYRGSASRTARFSVADAAELERVWERVLQAVRDGRGSVPGPLDSALEPAPSA